MIFDTISVKARWERWCRWNCDLRVINAFSVVPKASPWRPNHVTICLLRHSGESLQNGQLELGRRNWYFARETHKHTAVSVWACQAGFWKSTGTSCQLRKKTHANIEESTPVPSVYMLQASLRAAVRSWRQRINLPSSSKCPHSATMSVVPTPAVSFRVSSQHPPSASGSRPNTHRQLQGLVPTPTVSFRVSSQHPPSATVSRPNTRRQLQGLVPTPAVSYSVSSQHPPSATVSRPNTRPQLQYMSSQHPPSATVTQHRPSASVPVVPTPAVSYSVCRTNTRRLLQCLSFQHPPSASVYVVPTPTVSFSVCRPNTRRLLQCLSFQHPPSATATDPVIYLVSATETYASNRTELRILVWRKQQQQNHHRQQQLNS